MVWGGISKFGKTKLWINIDRERINKEKYCEIIENYALPLITQNLPQESILLQDGATCHTARYTKEYLSELGIRIQQNPPHSPDMNPIEMIWSIIKRSVSLQNPRTRNQLITAAVASWDAIEIETISKAINKLKSVLAPKVIESNGDWILK